MLAREYQDLQDRPDRLDQKEILVHKDHVALLENKVQRDLQDLREVLAPVLQQAMSREFCKLTVLVDRLKSLLALNHEEDRWEPSEAWWMRTRKSSIHFQKEMKMTEKTEAEKKAEKDQQEKSSGKKYDGGAIPKSSSKKNSSD
jgi:hypothetical protein